MKDWIIILSEMVFLKFFIKQRKLPRRFFIQLISIIQVYFFIYLINKIFLFFFRVSQLGGIFELNGNCQSENIEREN